MTSIIDAHTHLGDILYPDGGSIIEKKGVKKKFIFDPISIWAALYHRNYGAGNTLYRLFLKYVIIAEQERNFTATRENLRRSMDRFGIVRSVCMPVPPHVTFSDLSKAAQKDTGIIACTGVDFTNPGDPSGQLARDVAAGARGLKLHPIIQRASLTDPKTFAAVEAFSVHNLPILFHCGISSYYPKAEQHKNIPGFGTITDAANLVAAFPNVRFIAGHSGMFEVDHVMDLLGGYKNVWVDTSLQSPETIRKLVAVFGAEKVLFASDWPFGSVRHCIACVRKACRKDRGLEEAILFGNAAAVYGLQQVGP